MVARRAAVLVVPALMAGALALPATAVSPPQSDASRDATAARLAAVAAAPGATVLSTGPDGAPARTGGVMEALTVPAGGDLTARLRAMAVAIGAASGAPVLVLPEEAETSEFVTVGPAVFAVPAGDLDADGRDDVLTYRFDDEMTVLEARRGDDGALLWERPLDADAGLAYPAGADLTGDGRDDLLLESVRFAGEVSPAPLGYETTMTIDQTYGVASGADGRSQWTTTTRATIEESGAGTEGDLASAGRYELAATGLVLPLLSSDLNGDSSPDFVVNELDIHLVGDGVRVGADAAEVYRFTDSYRTSTRASAVDGRTGTPRDVRSSADLRGEALLLPLDHLDGSGRLLWQTVRLSDVDLTCVSTPVRSDCRDAGPGDVGFDAEVLAGSTGLPLWTLAGNDPSALLFPIDADADGDGVLDLGLEQHGQLAVLSGADGGQLWELGSDEQAQFLVAVDDATAVLLALAGTTDEPVLVLDRRDAASGRLLSTDRRSLPLAQHPDANERGLWLYARPLPDGDGDGRGELVVGSVSVAGLLDEQDFSYAQLAARSSASVEPVAGGAPLLTETSEDQRYLYGFGDLDGDGLQDVLRDVVTAVDGDDFGTDAQALRLRGGTPLWAFTGPFFQLPTPAGDQDGTPGTELLQTVLSPDTAVVLSRRGVDLGCRWAVMARQTSAVACT